ncbi:LysR family transcriptional regulator [Photobacterium sanguinicancri]|uniref:LysR family transcriptional regulator n=1 Tax=Photobacterium sanguinicancri TaxID=875932 RepID=A0AAW7YF02_9GAMM|nr:LysR family transcriptional regulator [Photobacterium sanguinicancri]KXI24084.1 transcriptional regulator [Photobacterium sanguinicancri]MDO6545344.1 LysR family transcriptional regulator [Photobacterium sanguinicancri]
MKNINLNLLVSLQALLEECHVSRAAERLHITQSAVSRQLYQLRDIFHDPLLIRDGNRLLMTPKAEQLKARVDAVLGDCQQILQLDTFDPQTWRGKVVLSSSDYVAQYILPDVVELLREHAPQVSVEYQLWQPDFYSELGQRDIHLFSSMLSSLPEGLCGEPIGADYPVCVMSQQHPLAQQSQLSLTDFLRYSHISVSGGGDKDSFIEQYLSSQGLQRDIKFRVPFFTSAFNTLSRSDMLMVVPEHIALNMKPSYPIHFLPLPMPVDQHKYWLMWHPKYDSDLPHQWLRQRVLTVMRDSMYSMSMS